MHTFNNAGDGITLPFDHFFFILDVYPGVAKKFQHGEISEKQFSYNLVKDLEYGHFNYRNYFGVSSDRIFKNYDECKKFMHDFCNKKGHLYMIYTVNAKSNAIVAYTHPSKKKELPFKKPVPIRNTKAYRNIVGNAKHKFVSEDKRNEKRVDITLSKLRRIPREDQIGVVAAALNETRLDLKEDFIRDIFKRLDNPTRSALVDFVRVFKQGQEQEKSLVNSGVFTKLCQF